MKCYLSLLAVVLLVTGCDQQKSSSLKGFIPGSYARSVQNEFSTGRDTLLIIEGGNNVFRLEHRISYKRITNGKMGPTESKVERWTALFDKGAGVLKETKRGRVISFHQEDNSLFVGSSRYNKIAH